MLRRRIEYGHAAALALALAVLAIAGCEIVAPLEDLSGAESDSGGGAGTQDGPIDATDERGGGEADGLPNGPSSSDAPGRPDVPVEAWHLPISIATFHGNLEGCDPLAFFPIGSKSAIGCASAVRRLALTTSSRPR